MNLAGPPLLPETVQAKAAGIRLLVLDVDGVLTDGGLHYDSEGRETKRFHVRDGYGLKALLRSGVEIAVISGRRSRATEARLSELGIRHARLGCDDKRAALAGFCASLDVPLAAVACVGDDVPDLPLLAAAGLAIAVADAHPEVLGAAHWQTRLGGGQGAVREVCDLLLQARAANQAPPP